MSAGALETLTWRQLNRAVLARQHLLTPAAKPLDEVVEDIGGLQTQYAPAGYVALFSRMAVFARGDLTTAMEERRVIHGTLMRSTIHTVSARDYWPVVAGVKRSRQEWALRTPVAPEARTRHERAGRLVRRLLAGGPRRARDLTAEIVALGHPPQALGRAGLWVDLVRIPPSGTWERRANDLYELADRWLPPEDVGGMPDETDGVRLLLRRYLTGFGPARINDFANWAGISLRLANAAAADCELRQFRDEQGRTLVDLPDRPLPAEDVAAPVRFLPVWDPTLLVHCRRALILPEEYRPLIFNTKTPHSFNSFLVDGQVCGTWRYDSGRVVTDVLRPLSAAALREVEAEADRLTRFYGD
jgi:hypothetical protein